MIIMRGEEQGRIVTEGYICRDQDEDRACIQEAKIALQREA